MKRQGTGSNPPRKGMADGASPSCFCLLHFQPISLWRGVGRKTQKASGRDWQSLGQRHLLAPLSPTDMRKAPPLSGADQPPWVECVPLKLDCWGADLCSPLVWKVQLSGMGTRTAARSGRAPRSHPQKLSNRKETPR